MFSAGSSSQPCCRTLKASKVGGKLQKVQLCRPFFLEAHTAPPSGDPTHCPLLPPLRTPCCLPPLHAGQDKMPPESTILVAIPANMQPGDTISTNMLRQRSLQGNNFIDALEGGAPAMGVPVGAMEDAMSAPVPGQLVFLPDLPSTLELWHKQRFLMMIWLVASLVSLVLFAPLFITSGLFLAAEIAAVMGVVAAIVQLCEKELASSNSECGRDTAQGTQARQVALRLGTAIFCVLEAAGQHAACSLHGSTH